MYSTYCSMPSESIGLIILTFLQLYKWSGENSYFVSGNLESLQIGGGGYVQGLF